MIATIFSTYVALAHCLDVDNAMKLYTAMQTHTNLEEQVMCRPLGMAQVSHEAMGMLEKVSKDAKDMDGDTMAVYLAPNGTALVIYIPNTEA